jgi:diketogulonate reductase-like aldo/keto reductase
MTNAWPTVTLPDGEAIPKLGQGTWEMGENPHARKAEIAALREGVDLGMTLIDTAEMYGDGESEKLIAEALGDRRDELFIVSKVYPHNGTERGVRAACERSLKRLGTDRVDLYLLHWRGGEDLEGVVAGFESLRRDGKIRHWGVSNFDVDDLEELFSISDGAECALDQVLFNVARRGPEFDLLPFLRERGMPLMAYSPVDHARLPAGGVLSEIASARGVSPFQIALAWVLQQDGVVAIPKAADAAHVRENFAAREIALSVEELGLIDREFSPPARKRGLEML